MRAAGPSRLRASAAGACAALLAGLVLSGCGTSTAASNSAVTVDGSTLTIWASEPPGDSGGAVAADVLHAEELAYDQFAASGARIGQLHVRFAVAHDDEVSADARQVVSDKTAIAYLGEIPPGTSGVSVQITNEVGLLQVSPTDTAVYLTHASAAVKDSPQTFYPARSNFHETFGRVVGTTAAEASAIVARMKAEKLTSVAVGDDGSQYGASIAAEVRSDASGAGLTVSSSAAGAGAYFYGGQPSATSEKAIDAAAAAAPSAKLFLPSALYDPTFVSSLSSGAQSALTVSAPGVPSSALDAVGKAFVTRFQAAYKVTPVPQAIFGYEAMRAVLAALDEAGSHAAVRQSVVADFLDLKRTASESAIGAYSLTAGDTNLDSFVFARVRGGRLVPSAQG